MLDYNKPVLGAEFNFLSNGAIFDGVHWTKLDIYSEATDFIYVYWKISISISCPDSFLNDCIECRVIFSFE